MNKAEAAEVLGCSLRQVEKFSSPAVGRLRVEYIKGKRGREARYDPADVERLRVELEAERETVIGTPPGIAGRESAQLVTRQPVAFEQVLALMAQPLDRIVERLEAMKATNGDNMPAPPALWLRIEEAAAWLGLPRKAIERALHDDRDGEGRQRTIKTLGRGGGLRLHASSARAYFERSQ